MTFYMIETKFKCIYLLSSLSSVLQRPMNSLCKVTRKLVNVNAHLPWPEFAGRNIEMGVLFVTSRLHRSVGIDSRPKTDYIRKKYIYIINQLVERLEKSADFKCLYFNNHYNSGSEILWLFYQWFRYISGKNRENIQQK